MKRTCFRPPIQEVRGRGRHRHHVYLEVLTHKAGMLRSTPFYRHLPSVMESQRMAKCAYSLTLMVR